MSRQTQVAASVIGLVFAVSGLFIAITDVRVHGVIHTPNAIAAFVLVAGGCWAISPERTLGFLRAMTASARELLGARGGADPRDPERGA